MKNRTGFVSNSSSSSFIVSLNHVTKAQLVLITHHQQLAPLLEIESVADEDVWDIRIEEDDRLVKGSTNMDNFDMDYYLREIGIDMEYVEWRT